MKKVADLLFQRYTQPPVYHPNTRTQATSFGVHRFVKKSNMKDKVIKDIDGNIGEQHNGLYGHSSIPHMFATNEVKGEPDILLVYGIFTTSSAPVNNIKPMLVGTTIKNGKEVPQFLVPCNRMYIYKEDAKPVSVEKAAEINKRLTLEAKKEMSKLDHIFDRKPTDNNNSL